MDSSDLAFIKELSEYELQYLHSHDIHKLRNIKICRDPQLQVYMSDEFIYQCIMKTNYNGNQLIFRYLFDKFKKHMSMHELNTLLKKIHYEECVHHFIGKSGNRRIIFNNILFEINQRHEKLEIKLRDELDKSNEKCCKLMKLLEESAKKKETDITMASTASIISNAIAKSAIANNDNNNIFDTMNLKKKYEKVKKELEEYFIEKREEKIKKLEEENVHYIASIDKLRNSINGVFLKLDELEINVNKREEKIKKLEDDNERKSKRIKKLTTKSENQRKTLYNLQTKHDEKAGALVHNTNYINSLIFGSDELRKYNQYLKNTNARLLKEIEKKNNTIKQIKKIIL